MAREIKHGAKGPVDASTAILAEEFREINPPLPSATRWTVGIESPFQGVSEALKHKIALGGIH